MKKIGVFLAFAAMSAAGAYVAICSAVEKADENQSTTNDKPPVPVCEPSPRKVALVVQNHTSDAPTLPMAAFADTLTARLSGNTLRIVNPHNVIGVNQNRTAKGEVMPEASVQEIGRMLGADGVVTASIQEFTGEDIGVPAIAHTLKVRLALNLADTATGGEGKGRYRHAVRGAYAPCRRERRGETARQGRVSRMGAERGEDDRRVLRL